MSPNVTRGRDEALKSLKKCHILFEWPLSRQKKKRKGQQSFHIHVSHQKFLEEESVFNAPLTPFMR